MMYDDYTVGQTVFIHDRHGNQGQKLEETRVVEVGRKWVRFANGTKAERGQRDLAPSQQGYASQGMLFLSREEHALWMMDEKAWTQFCRDIQYARRPQHASLEVIQKVRDILKLPYKE